MFMGLLYVFFVVILILAMCLGMFWTNLEYLPYKVINLHKFGKRYLFKYNVGVDGKLSLKIRHKWCLIWLDGYKFQKLLAKFCDEHGIPNKSVAFPTIDTIYTLVTDICKYENDMKNKSINLRKEHGKARSIEEWLVTENV